ncbi:hypothetical protein ACFL2Q_20335, partial [Thermodesulfobacteriota bacterium]
MKGQTLEKDLNFWEKLAPDYDRHARRFGKSQEQVIRRLREQVHKAQTEVFPGTAIAACKLLI